MIHPLSDCKSSHIGQNTNIWQFCVIFPNAVIGDNCNICANVLIENDVKVGANCTVKSGVQLWNGVTLEDNVFVGPNVTFTNDLCPRSKNPDWKLSKTIVKKGASIGANATILAGVTIGENAMVGAGSVVTHDVPANAVIYGNPARVQGKINANGEVVKMNNYYTNNGGGVCKKSVFHAQSIYILPYGKISRLKRKRICNY